MQGLLLESLQVARCLSLQLSVVVMTEWKHLQGGVQQGEPKSQTQHQMLQQCLYGAG
jgi:hypothetical protein